MPNIFKRNLVVGTASSTALLFTFVEDLIAQGWRVLGSGDGISFENQGSGKGVGCSSARLVTPNKASLVDGETFTLTNASAVSTVFEFDVTGNGVGGGNVAINLASATTEQEVAAAIASTLSANGYPSYVGYRAGLYVAGGDPSSTASVIITQSAAGVAGDTTPSETVSSASFSISPFTGGGTGGLGSGGQYHVHTTSSLARVTSSWAAGDWANLNAGATMLGASWVRLGTPTDAFSAAELVLQLSFDASASSGGSIIATYSPENAFVHGASRWQRPGADAAIRLGTTIGPDDPENHCAGNNASVSFIFPAAGRLNYVLGDVDSDYDILLWTINSSTSGMYSMFARLSTFSSASRPDSDLDPDQSLLICYLPSSENSSTDISAVGSSLFSAFNITGKLEDTVGLISSPSAIAGYMVGATTDPSDLSGHYPAFLTNRITTASNESTFASITDNKPTAMALIGSTLLVKGTLYSNFLFVGNRGGYTPRLEAGPYPGDPIRVSFGRFSLLWESSSDIEVL